MCRNRIFALSIVLLALTGAAPLRAQQAPAQPSGIDGAWVGTLDTGSEKLRTIFHFTSTADGLTATVDSPDQDANGLPVTSVTRNGLSLTVEMKQLDGKFEGKIDKDLQRIEGIWSQRGGTLPLVLTRVKEAAELEQHRPQDPVKPYPYHEEEVSYENPAAGIKLAATLTVPAGKGPFPAVLLIAGSGPNDRDERLMGHRPFLVLADYLTRHGIEVLRADKRGVGKSGGETITATTADFATDAEAGLEYLAARPEVNHARMGLLGHSEGGEIAPMVAARNHKVAFLVLLAAPGVRGDELTIQQTLLLSEASGASHEQAEENAAQERKVLALVEQEKDGQALGQKLRATGLIPEEQLGGALLSLNSPWYRSFIEYDPAVTLRKITCPVLALIGEKDLQVPPAQNLPVIRKALTAAGNKHFAVEELPGLNHLFQTAQTGLPTEYGTIEETMSPLVLDRIATWIGRQ
jgi:pimeloyl-ACP methyl ester carboxylesterase